jgi:hypothetical protein
MGMFNDNLGARRSEWTYLYTGEELLPYARKLYGEFYKKEHAAREQMASYMRDMNISQNDQKVQEVKRDIQTYGSLKEQCDVFQHEFARNLTQPYQLGLGDITFFGLTQPAR